MARINLLPWREELREQRKQQFLVILGGVLFGFRRTGVSWWPISQHCD